MFLTCKAYHWNQQKGESIHFESDCCEDENLEFKFCDDEIGLLKWIDAYDTTAKGFNSYVVVFFFYIEEGLSMRFHLQGFLNLGLYQSRFFFFFC